MTSELLLTALSALLSLTLLTVVILSMVWMRKSQTVLADLHRESLLLLAAKDSREFELMRSVLEPPSPSYDPESQYHYTGDQRETENERIKGNLNDDELTHLSGFGL